MIKQNDKRLLPKINKIGCYFMCCADIAQMQTKKELTPEQINEGWVWSKKNYHINLADDLLHRHAEDIITYFLHVLGDEGKIEEVGMFETGQCIWYGTEQGGDYFIQKIEQGGPSKTHFRIVDKYGVVLEDPAEPPIKSKRAVYSRIFKYKESIYDI